MEDIAFGSELPGQGFTWTGAGTKRWGTNQIGAFLPGLGTLAEYTLDTGTRLTRTLLTQFDQNPNPNLSHCPLVSVLSNRPLSPQTPEIFIEGKIYTPISPSFVGLQIMKVAIMMLVCLFGWLFSNFWVFVG